MTANAAPRPILISLPHAHSAVPEEVKDIVLLAKEDLLGYTDLHTEKIFGVKNVHTVEAIVSRVIVDVNRAPDDISKEYELAAEGVIVHTTWDGKSVYKKEPSQKLVDALIKKYHEPFHERIDAAMPNVEFLIDCHSYLPVGPKLKRDSGLPRPDFNIGNANYSSCSRKHTVFFRDFFQERGYTVEINFPYAGKYILGHHCHRRRIPGFLVPGIQIEINQGLYLKHDSHDFIPERIDEFHTLFEKLVDAFCTEFCSVTE